MRTTSLFATLVTAAALLSPWTAPEALAVTEGKTAQGELYLSGGISLDERAALDVRRTAFSLRVATAAKKTGSYLADVRVGIADARGNTVLDTRLDGPWLLVALKPGRYTVQASFRGQVQSKMTTVHSGDHHEMLFYFNLEVETLPRRAGS